MSVRLAFAVASHLDPEILLVDEVLAVGDAAFQRKSLGKMGEVAREGRTVIFVSHNLAIIQALCSRGVLLERGQVVADAPATQAIDEYLRTLERTAACPSCRCYPGATASTSCSRPGDKSRTASRPPPSSTSSRASSAAVRRRCPAATATSSSPTSGRCRRDPVSSATCAARRRGG